MNRNQIEILPSGNSFEMIYVAGGKFAFQYKKHEIENERNIWKVELSSFYMGRYPVTQSLWCEIMDQNPSYYLGNDRPIDNASWKQANIFIKKLNSLTNSQYRLPTEAEWEYAAKGGIKSHNYKYAGSDKLDEVGWFSGNSDDETKAVGQLAPNELGIYDMSGNVWEWCNDWYSLNYHEQFIRRELIINPQGPKYGSYHVYRGGSWVYSPYYSEVIHRPKWRPGGRVDDIGFRLAMSIS